MEPVPLVAPPSLARRRRFKLPALRMSRTFKRLSAVLLVLFGLIFALAGFLPGLAAALALASALFVAHGKWLRHAALLAGASTACLFLFFGFTILLKDSGFVFPACSGPMSGLCIFAAETVKAVGSPAIGAIWLLVGAGVLGWTWKELRDWMLELLEKRMSEQAAASPGPDGPT